MSLAQKAFCATLCLLSCSLLKGQQSQRASSNVQADFTRLYGSEDGDIVTPDVRCDWGRQDPGALKELIEYLKVTAISTWEGISASGTNSSPDGIKESVTLTIGRANGFRLDVDTASGKRSTRINGDQGVTREPNGTILMLPASAAQTGLVHYVRLFSPNLVQTSTSIIDRGLIQINGKGLHRITIEEPAVKTETPQKDTDGIVIDFYFDPSTHLLAASATLMQLEAGDINHYLVVVNYGDYTRVGTTLVPLSLHESVNGQYRWTLQLNLPDLQPSVDDSFFQF